MIESLMEIQIAYSMIDDKTCENPMLHPLDSHYLKLNCAIDVSYIVQRLFPIFLCKYIPILLF